LSCGASGGKEAGKTWRIRLPMKIKKVAKWGVPGKKGHKGEEKAAKTGQNECLEKQRSRTGGKETRGGEKGMKKTGNPEITSPGTPTQKKNMPEKKEKRRRTSGGKKNRGRKDRRRRHYLEGERDAEKKFSKGDLIGGGSFPQTTGGEGGCEKKKNPA